MIGEGKIAEAISQFGEAPNGYTSNPGKQSMLGPQTGVYYLLINNGQAPMDNPDVRKAISLAINRQAICDVVFDGTRDPAGNIVPPGVAGYVENSWEDSRYDVDGAKKALEDAGYPGGEGIDKLTLSFNSGGGHEKIMELIQADLAEIGIESEFEALEWDTYLKRLQDGNYTFGRLGWAADYPIAYNFLYSLFDSKAGDNLSGYNNPDIDKAIVDAEKDPDPEARANAMAEVSKIVGESNPVVPIMYYKHNYIGSDRMNDLTFGPMHLVDYMNMWISADRR
jgi:peptide/nickel transport system substrate-binding protein/oligopeptide transport system substrate-binding protein